MNLPGISDAMCKRPVWSLDGVKLFKEREAPYRPNIWNWMAEKEGSTIVLVLILVAAALFAVFGTVGSAWGRFMFMAVFLCLGMLSAIGYFSVSKPKWEEVPLLDVLRRWDAYGLTPLWQNEIRLRRSLNPECEFFFEMIVPDPPRAYLTAMVEGPCILWMVEDVYDPRKGWPACSKQPLLVIGRDGKAVSQASIL